MHDSKNPASYRKSYPQTRASVGEARRAIVTFAQACGFNGQTLDDIEVAVGEALANAVEHGCRERGSFEVFVDRDAHVLGVEIKDSGRGFDYQRAYSCSLPPAESSRGFGTFIMRELMDGIEYSERGTRLRLTKRLLLPTAVRNGLMLRA